MNAAAKLGAYGAVLAAAVVGGAAVGSAVGPIDVGGDDGHRGKTHVQAGVEADAPVPSDRAVVDGFEVSLQGDLEPGGTAEVGVTVTRDGAPVTPEAQSTPWRLVALRGGDLAPVHVHPLPASPTEAARFAVEVPSPGPYALVFDFAVDGTVRTAHFVVIA